MIPTTAPASNYCQGLSDSETPPRGKGTVELSTVDGVNNNNNNQKTTGDG